MIVEVADVIHVIQIAKVNLATTGSKHLDTHVKRWKDRLIAIATVAHPVRSLSSAHQHAQ